MDLLEAGFRHLAGDVLRNENPHVMPDVLREFLSLGTVLTKMESIVHRYRIRNAGDLAKEFLHALVKLMRECILNGVRLA